MVEARALAPNDLAFEEVLGRVANSPVIESRLGAEGLRDLDMFIDRADIEIIAVDLKQGRLARQAFRQGPPPR